MKTNHKEIDDLIEVSSRMGLDKSLIQASGGNTSIKIKDYMLIKASGKTLANASSENIFIKVNPKDYYSRKGGKLYVKSNPKYQSYIGGLKPSIETGFHAILPNKVVLHSHPIDIIANTMVQDFKVRASNALNNMKWLFINYVRPGEDLAKNIANSIEENINIFILQNHGLIVGADTAKEAEDIQKTVVKLLKIKKRKLVNKTYDDMFLLSNSIPGSYLPKEEIINTLATDPFSFELSKTNPYSPDHLVFCGIRPLILEDIKQDWNRLIKEHEYAIIKGKGVLLFGKRNKYLEEMLMTQAEVFARIKLGQSISTLKTEECLGLLEWEAERYRRSIIKK